ncbi:MAG TPA: hypothetical protein VLT88_15950, partial [Desulfosarcina sp.]|nr:hypothetical protein [Desulfosarcina sp.]
TVPIVVHAMADIMAKQPTLEGRDRRFVAFCDRLLAAYDDACKTQEAAPPLIDGRDLITVFGLSPSPLFRRLLGRVNELRLCGELSTRDQALAWVADHLRTEVEGRRPAVEG